MIHNRNTFVVHEHTDVKHILQPHEYVIGYTNVRNQKVIILIEEIDPQRRMLLEMHLAG